MGTCIHTFNDSLVLTGPGGLYGNNDFSNASMSKSNGAFTTTFNDLINIGTDGPYSIATSTTGFCSCVNYQFYNSGNQGATVYPQPLITALTDGNYNSFSPYVDTPQSANQYLIVWGSFLTAGGASNPPTISVNGVSSAGGAISVSGFHLGGGWYVGETTSTGASQINIPYWVDANATPGTYTLTLQTVRGSTQTTFVVGDATPVITSVSPSGWNAGTTTNFTLIGSGFGTNPSLSISGSGILSYSLLSGSDTLISGTVNIDASAPGSNATVTVTSNGYYGQPFDPVRPGQPPASTIAPPIYPLTVTQSPATLNLSTGDTNLTITTVVTPSITFTPAFSWGLQSNPNSSCAANLGFTSNSGTGSVNETVTASPPGCSGIFSAQAVVGTKTSGTATQIVVPPQILVQMLYGEAHGQAAIGDNTSQLAIGVATRNRFTQGGYFSNVSTYQAAITTGQFNGISNIANGPIPDINNAAAVFASTTSVSTANAACFFSPTATEWIAVQGAYNNQTTILPTVTHDPGCYYPGNGTEQFVIKQSVGNNANGSGAPAFVFTQLRAASAPAVIQIQ